MTFDLIFSFLLVCGGVIFAAHAHEGQRRAILNVAIMWAIQWVIYNATWYQISPHRFVGINYTQYWSLLDFILGYYVVEKAIEFWWGKVLFGLLALQISAHVIHSLKLWDFLTYSQVLDYFFYIQAVVFIFNGGAGIGNRISDIVSGFGHGLGKNKTASRKETP